MARREKLVPPVVAGVVDLVEGEHFAGLERRHSDLVVIDEHDDAGVFMHDADTEVVESTRATQRDFECGRFLGCGVTSPAATSTRRIVEVEGAT